jgi:hypothetical protein
VPFGVKHYSRPLQGLGDSGLDPIAVILLIGLAAHGHLGDPFAVNPEPTEYGTVRQKLEFVLAASRPDCAIKPVHDTPSVDVGNCQSPIATNGLGLPADFFVSFR